MNQAAQNYIRSTRLTDIVDFQHIARGVNMEITQLDAGSFESDVSQLKVRNVLASLTTSNRRLRLHGSVNFLTVSFISQKSGSPKWHGISAKPNVILAANAGETFDLVFPPGAAAYCVSVTGDAEVTLRNLGGPVLAGQLSGTAHPISCDPIAIRQIRGWLEERFAGFSADTEISNALAMELEQEFLRRLAACMRAGQAPFSDGDSTVDGKTDIVRRVEQHLLEDLAIPQSVDALCRVAGTSRRTLEYAFRDCFGTSPQRFIKALRLNAARNDLVRGDYGSAQVVEIASGWGFTHMGQFSSDYANMFGEKPSETLRRSLPHAYVGA